MKQSVVLFTVEIKVIVQVVRDRNRSNIIQVILNVGVLPKPEWLRSSNQKVQNWKAYTDKSSVANIEDLRGLG